MTKTGKIAWFVCTAAYMGFVHMALMQLAPPEDFEHWRFLVLWVGNCGYCLICGLVLGWVWFGYWWTSIGNAVIFLAASGMQQVPFEKEEHVLYFAGLYLGVTVLGLIIGANVFWALPAGSSKKKIPGEEEYEAYKNWMYGTNGYRQNMQTAILCLKEAAAAGYPGAQAELEKVVHRTQAPKREMSGREVMDKAREAAREAVESVPPEMMREYISIADAKIADGTAEKQSYITPALMYIEGMQGVPKDNKKALKYFYGLVRKDPDAGIELFYRLAAKDKEIMTVTGVDPNEEKIRELIGLIKAAELMRDGGIQLSSGEDPNTDPQMQEIIRNIPSLKAQLKEM